MYSPLTFLFAFIAFTIMKGVIYMKKKFNFEIVKDYALPVAIGIFTIITGISEKKSQKRNIELEQKLDALNKKLEESN